MFSEEKGVWIGRGNGKAVMLPWKCDECRGDLTERNEYGYRKGLKNQEGLKFSRKNHQGSKIVHCISDGRAIEWC